MDVSGPVTSYQACAAAKLSMLFAGVLALALAGCGGEGSTTGSTAGPIPGQSTSVVLQITSTANSKFVQFGMQVDQIKLTNEAGETTTVFATPTFVDFLSANGDAAPLATVSIPQGTYTSATISVSRPSFTFVYENEQGQIYFATDAYGYTPTPPTVTLSSPLVVSGTAMGMTLNLQASDSGSYTGLPPNQSSYSITPAFTLSSFAVGGGGTASSAGICHDLNGQVTSVGTNSITVKLPGNLLTGAPAQKVALTSSTVYLGGTSATSFAVDDLVNFDMQPQADGSYAATRIDRPDAGALDQATGQLVEVAPSSSYLSTMSAGSTGVNYSTQPAGLGAPYIYSGATAFKIADGANVWTGLPFQPVFDATTLAAGQRVSISSNGVLGDLQGGRTSATSVTLVPQTINGLVLEEATSGNYTVDTVRLASYDAIVQLNSPASASVLTTVPEPNVVVVYRDSSTTMVNSAHVIPGVNSRFTGILLNDNGTLRMVAQRVNAGVTQ